MKSRPPLPATAFALIDCNNFFVSCERLFRPDLEGRPVVVLSSNDGCAIARSNEAKALGIPMGAPAFKYRQLFRDEGVVQFSANFELYGDISDRITRVLTGITPRTEVYSVDESFLELQELEIDDYYQWGQTLRQRLLREVGMPVSVGIAPTKTLAKLAREHAKKDNQLAGVLNLLDTPDEDRIMYLQRTPINDVWGVGWRLTPRLRAEGVHTALDLANLSPQLASQLMGVHGRQMVAELNGLCCHPLERMGKVRQSVMHGRLFGSDTNQFSVVEAAVASLTARAAFRLRKEHLLAHSAVVSLNTNRHKPNYQRTSKFVSFRAPTADTGLITAELVRALGSSFNRQASYHRANVLLHDLISETAIQTDLFGKADARQSDRSGARLQAVDNLNQRYGKQTVRYAAEDLSQAWEPKHVYRSPRFTTQWQELPTIKDVRP
jgi:DNA polymerase V